MAERNGELTVKNGWLACPICRQNRKLLRVEPETQATNLPVYCRKCHNETILNIERGQRVRRQSP